MKNFDLFLSSFVFLFAFTCAETHHDSGLHNQSDLKAEASTYVDQVNIDVPKALQEDLTSNITQQIYQRSLNIQTNSRWKDRLNSIVQVPYYIDPNYFTVDQINTIENAILTLSNEAKVVKFIPRTNQAAYINIVDTTGGCSSFVGKSPTGKSQDLNLSTDGCLIPGIIQHELLHAIGFFHEQSRPDRDSYVRINLSNVNPKNRHNFDIASGSSLLDSEYDYSSLMHYEKYDFAIDASVETIIPLQSGVSALGQREGLTSDDIAKIHLLYQCISGPRNLESYKNDPCTVDCPCWEGATGCNGVDAACRTGLICSNNQCVIGTSTGGGGVGTTDESCTDVPGWIDAEGDGCIW